MSLLENTHISHLEPILSPDILKNNHPISSKLCNVVIQSRNTISNILSGNDDRHLLIIGPCSIHDYDAAIEYANQLAELSKTVSDKIFVVMRAYFEKPRTNIGWKGFISDPNLDGSCDIEKGLTTARRLLLDILSLGLPTGSELLDPILPQYYADLICWASIGARTSESQTHREMASGLSMPIGFKNGTDGNIDVALHAIQSAQHQHTFIGVSQNGTISKVQSTGNPDSHLIIRGGSNGPNYSSVQMDDHIEKIQASSINTRILVDCSHGNSRKKAENQQKVLNSICNQISSGNTHIMGVMIESFITHGNQDIHNTPRLYGQSITDECIGWNDTKTMIHRMYDALK